MNGGSQKGSPLKHPYKLPITLAILLTFFTTSVKPARASIPSGTQVGLIFAAVGVIGAGIGVGIYYAVAHKPAITGCAASSADGLTLQNESDQRAFTLIGETSSIKAGDRVQIRGKKSKTTAGASLFKVESLR
jgi:hypothetical protein